MLDKNAAGIEVNAIVTPQIPKSAVVQCTAANTSLDAPTNIVQLLQAGPRGGRLTKLKATPAVNVTATQLQLFREPAGGDVCFTHSELMGAHNISATTKTPSTDFGYSNDSPLQLGPNEILHVGIGVAGKVNFEAEWCDY
jgi:hypothetical protein